jgi:hypothetical protein
MKNFFKSLFSDKSFWAALVSIVSCVCVALNVPQGSVTQITSFIGGLGTILAYIINNGIQTAAAIKAQAQKDIVNAQLKAQYPMLQK